MYYPEFYPLTAEEISQGWHFCPEFDFLLVGPRQPEQDFCDCFHTIQGLKEDEDVY
jgi:hypothetical protein